jgi:hypothetical protein
VTPIPQAILTDQHKCTLYGADCCERVEQAGKPSLDCLSLAKYVSGIHPHCPVGARTLK